MIRFKTYVATGVAPNGRLFAGDLNLFQDSVAGLTDFTQVVSVQELKVGDSGLGITKFGSGEFQMSGSLRTSATGILKGLGGLFAGTYTTTQRNAISSPLYGLIILNTTTNQFEWNIGSPGAPSWVALDSVASAALTAHLNDTVDAHDASAISYVGGPGMSATDVEAAIDELATEKLDATAIPGAWSNFTPALIGSTGNPTYGTGGVAGKIMKIGRTVFYKMIFRWVGGTTGSGFYTVSVPTGAQYVPLEWEVASNAKVLAGTWDIIFNNGDMATGVVTIRDADEFFLAYPVGSAWPSAGSNLGAPASVPQSISIQGFYEATT